MAFCSSGIDREYARLDGGEELKVRSMLQVQEKNHGKFKALDLLNLFGA